MWQVETYSVSKLELLMLVAYCTYSATASYKVCFRSFYRLIQYRNWNYWCSSPIARIRQLHLIKYVSGVFTRNKSHLDFCDKLRLIQYRNWNYWCSSPIARIQQLHLIKYVSGVFTDLFSIETGIIDARRLLHVLHYCTFFYENRYIVTLIQQLHLNPLLHDFFRNFSRNLASFKKDAMR